MHPYTIPYSTEEPEEKTEVGFPFIGEFNALRDTFPYLRTLQAIIKRIVCDKKILYTLDDEVEKEVRSWGTEFYEEEFWALREKILNPEFIPRMVKIKITGR